MPIDADAEARPVEYMERTRRYYRALGYDQDYSWAHFDDVPFMRLSKPIREARIGLVTTAGPHDRSNRDSRGRKQVWSGAVATPPVTLETDLAWDKDATHTDDRETFLPVTALARLVAEGRCGGVAARFHGVPTGYSHRKTLERDAPEIVHRLKDDGADAAILTAL